MRDAVIGALLVVVVALSGCDSDGESQQLDASEAEEITRIFQTGVGHPDDPFVRAETYRVFELLAEPSFGELAAKGVSDADPTVRLAALRAALAAKHPRGRSMALDQFRKRDGAERMAILRAALEHGSPPLKREIVGRALRTRDPKLRYFAFTNGLLARVEAAAAADDEANLERHLLPDLGTYVTLEDPVLAALALKKFVDLGKDDRAKPLIQKFENRRAPLDERVRAGAILAGAHAPSAQPAFAQVVKRWERSMDDDRLGIPQTVVPAELLRVAILGMIATGDSEYVSNVQKYTKNVSDAEMLEVLEALSANPSEDASVSLKIAMQDARADVRSFAVDRYKDRDDASPRALYAVLPSAPYATQRQVAVVLWNNFPDQWVALNKEALQRSSEVDGSLRLLRNVVNSPDEIKHLAPLEKTLEEITNDAKDERAELAKYLLRLITESRDAKPAAAVALDSLDPETTYAYLEFLVRSESSQPEIYRKYIYSDFFAHRLMSAAGLWRITGGSVAGAAVGESETDESGDESEPESESAE